MQDSNNIFEFFKPTPELTEEIIKQNQALVKEYAARTAPEETVELNEDEPGFVQFGYQRPLSRTVKSAVETAQQVITERTYHYLSSLAESPWAMEGGSFAVSEYLPKGLITMLGFSSIRKQPESPRAMIVEQLIERLTEEFVNWLANQQNGAFVTPWLEMHLTKEGELLLIAIPETQDEEDSTVEIAHDAQPSSAAAACGRGFTATANVSHLSEITGELVAITKKLKVLEQGVAVSGEDEGELRQGTSMAAGQTRMEENAR